MDQTFQDDEDTLEKEKEKSGNEENQFRKAEKEQIVSEKFNDTALNNNFVPEAFVNQRSLMELHKLKPVLATPT